MTSKKILIVDDDPDLVLGLTLRLKANGYSVVSAVDAASGLEANREQKPDLIILDLGLPGNDGFSVLEQIKIPGGAVPPPTIVLSGRNAHGNKERAVQAGAFAFLQKPPENGVLLSSVKLALGGEGLVSERWLSPPSSPPGGPLSSSR